MPTILFSSLAYYLYETADRHTDVPGTASLPPKTFAARGPEIKIRCKDTPLCAHHEIKPLKNNVLFYPPRQRRRDVLTTPPWHPHDGVQTAPQRRRRKTPSLTAARAWAAAKKRVGRDCPAGLPPPTVFRRRVAVAALTEWANLRVWAVTARRPTPKGSIFIFYNIFLAGRMTR